MNVLSIHSHVSVGCIGNAAAVPALRRLGHEVWPVHTVLLSHHPGHGGWHGPRVAAGDVAAVLGGLEGRGALANCDAVLSGYMGGVEVGDVVCDAWMRVRAASPNALIACDPILGDEAEGLYVAEDLVGFYRQHAVPAADVIFPNRFELALLSGSEVNNVAGAVVAARRLMNAGPRMTLATSVPASGGLATVLVTKDEAVRVTAPRLDVKAKGAGDVFAALWLGHFLNDRTDAVGALRRAAAGTRAVLERAAAAKLEELPLLETQARWTRVSTEALAAERI